MPRALNERATIEVGTPATVGGLTTQFRVDRFVMGILKTPVPGADRRVFPPRAAGYMAVIAVGSDGRALDGTVSGTWLAGSTIVMLNMRALDFIGAIGIPLGAVAHVPFTLVGAHFTWDSNTMVVYDRSNTWRATDIFFWLRGRDIRVESDRRITGRAIPLDVSRIIVREEVVPYGIWFRRVGSPRFVVSDSDVGDDSVITELSQIDIRPVRGIGPNTAIYIDNQRYHVNGFTPLSGRTLYRVDLVRKIQLHLRAVVVGERTQ